MRGVYVERVTAKNLRKAITENVKPEARLNTDEHKGYKPIGRNWEGGHDYVRHEAEYVNPYSPLNHINTAESFFALFKRGLHGSFHHVSKGHLQRYTDEFVFRWNNRTTTDGVRTRAALQGGDGVRPTYRLARA